MDFKYAILGMLACWPRKLAIGSHVNQVIMVAKFL